ncbi:aspartate dehydrogenase [Teichococcus vastitatis]|uniref:L-aspartate dehydrogenase n=1 Tax=Teichococcus vastitatis TaxID=2307076 RepID=A0ABS9W1X2_9PROT|nr:aspartate dehydrogenase [Pseudoroseomonas vastitatis]MCI0752935.1 aspartate dehydrogenase [Pseudoroseomonas vastitatis]
MNAIAPPRRRPLRVAIAGFGAIGQALALALDRGIPGFELSVVSAREKPAAARRMEQLRNPVPVLDIAELEPQADLVVECAPAALLPSIVEPFLRAGKNAVVISAGALLQHDHLASLAAQHGAHIIVPTGALIGLDAMLAAAEGEVTSVRMITRKPVRGLLGAPYLTENNIRIEGIEAPLRVFEGTAREAARGFPANLNVAVALSLAGIGPDRTRLEIWADPTVTRNTHRIEVEADSARFAMSIENVPSDNPKTGRITALSVIACLRKMQAPLRIGT